jgi:hypothetical protein
MKTTNETKILLSENAEIIELLRTKVPDIADKMTQVLTEYNEFEIELPKLDSVATIIGLKDVKRLVTSQIENDIPESQLKVGGLKISRDKLTELLELPDYSELEGAVSSLQSSLDSRFSNPALYEIKAGKVHVVDSVLQSQIEQCKTYARPDQAEMFYALEKIAQQLNDVVLPKAAHMPDGYILNSPLSLADHPRYEINYEKLFKAAFGFDGHKKTVEVNKRFIADLR